MTTAGNASGINDGAVAMIVASRKAGDAAGAEPLARVVASGVAGVPPRVMGIGPVEASKKALARAGLSLSDIDVIEINEAFAAQVLACLRGLDLAFDDSRVNQNGGAIAIGHPLGASGPRIALTAARQLRAHRRPLRAGDDVRRRRPGHRRGARTGLRREWGKASTPLSARPRAERKSMPASEIAAVRALLSAQPRPTELSERRKRLDALFAPVPAADGRADRGGGCKWGRRRMVIDAGCR